MKNRKLTSCGLLLLALALGQMGSAALATSNNIGPTPLPTPTPIIDFNTEAVKPEVVRTPIVTPKPLEKGSAKWVELEALKKLRLDVAKGIPLFTPEEKEAFIQANLTDLTPYGDVSVSHDLVEGTTATYSMDTLEKIDSLDPNAQSLLTKATLQLLLHPEDLELTAEEMKEAGFSSYQTYDKEITATDGLKAAVIERFSVTNTTQNPFSAICHVIANFPWRTAEKGTGFLINGNTLVTAGHVLYNVSFGGWATSVTVIPARDSNWAPYGQYSGTSMSVGGSWYFNTDYNGDWGIARLDRNTTVPNRFELAERTNEQLYSWGPVTQAGYHLDYPYLHSPNAGVTMMRSSGNISNVDQYMFMSDAYGSGGVSGAPVYDPWGWVVGIARSGVDSTHETHAVRINQGMIDYFDNY